MLVFPAEGRQGRAQRCCRRRCSRAQVCLWTRKRTRQKGGRSSYSRGRLAGRVGWRGRGGAPLTCSSAGLFLFQVGADARKSATQRSGQRRVKHWDPQLHLLQVPTLVPPPQHPLSNHSSETIRATLSRFCRSLHRIIVLTVEGDVLSIKFCLKNVGSSKTQSILWYLSSGRVLAVHTSNWQQ